MKDESEWGSEDLTLGMGAGGRLRSRTGDGWPRACGRDCGLGPKIGQIVRATTVVGIRRSGCLALAADGQVTVGDVVMKHNARKVRTLYHGQVLAGFAGAVADAFALFEKFESQLERHGGSLRRGAVELAKEWRTDRYLRRLEAWLVVGNREELLVLSGDGEVIEPDDNIVGIGSGGAYAHAAARALISHTSLSAAEVARASLEIAASLCIYTNSHVELLELGIDMASSPVEPDS